MNVKFSAFFLETDRYQHLSVFVLNKSTEYSTLLWYSMAWRDIMGGLEFTFIFFT